VLEQSIGGERLGVLPQHEGDRVFGSAGEVE
jgi:hypothetical protein